MTDAKPTRATTSRTAAEIGAHIRETEASHRPLLISYGGGVDSTAVLVGLHQRGIVPDSIMFADAGGELPETYAYLECIAVWLEDRGFPHVDFVKRTPVRATYTTLEENCLQNKTLPSLAFGRKACSLKWKVEPLDKARKNLQVCKNAWENGILPTIAIGYNNGAKDRRRSSKKTDGVFNFWYPLREWGWDRARCELEISRAGLPVPPKSSCFFCPAMTPRELTRLTLRHPELADRIIEMERAAAPNLKKIDGLWRRGRKGARGGMRYSGSMSDWILRVRSGDSEALRSLVAPATSEPPLLKYLRLISEAKKS